MLTTINLPSRRQQSTLEACMCKEHSKFARLSPEVFLAKSTLSWKGKSYISGRRKHENSVKRVAEKIEVEVSLIRIGEPLPLPSHLANDSVTIPYGLLTVSRLLSFK